MSRTDCALDTSPSFVANQQTQLTRCRRSFVSTALAELNPFGVFAVPGKLNVYYFPQFMSFPSGVFFFILLLYFYIVTFGSLDKRIKRNHYKVPSFHLITATAPDKY